MIINDQLSEEEAAKLITILEKHRSVLGYSLQDLKGISPALCTHRIPIEPDATPSREPQRRLNNAISSEEGGLEALAHGHNLPCS